MSEFLMRRPRDLFTRNKQVRRKLKRNQTVLIVPSDMMLTKARFGVLAKWKQTMYQHGLGVVRLRPRIVRCCAKLIIEQRAIGNQQYFLLTTKNINLEVLFVGMRRMSSFRVTFKRMIDTDRAKIDDIVSRSIFSILPSKDALVKELSSGRRLRIYIGVDPTGPDLHLGHATNFILLEKLRKLGHEVIVLFGDFTATIGDPTGKEAVRRALTPQEIAQNIKTWKRQAGKVLNFFDKENPARIKKNAAWLSKLTFTKVIELSANFTLQQMIERDMFQKRIAEKQPVYLHEFFYPLMQGYDSVHMDVDVEVGGSDQIFNMGVGRTLQRKINNKEKFIIATTLLENTKTGKKLMSKSEGSYIALSDKPKDMYGKVMALPDEVIVRMFIDTTLLPMEEIYAIEKTLQGGESFRNAKMRLAFEIVKTYWNEKKALRAQKDFVRTFQKGDVPESVDTVFAERGEDLASIVLGAQKVSSRGEFRRLVLQGAVRDA